MTEMNRFEVRYGIILDTLTGHQPSVEECCELLNSRPSPWVVPPKHTPDDRQTVDVQTADGKRFINCIFWAESEVINECWELMDLDGYQIELVSTDEIEMWRPADEPPRWE